MLRTTLNRSLLYRSRRSTINVSATTSTKTKNNDLANSFSLHSSSVVRTKSTSTTRRSTPPTTSNRTPLPSLNEAVKAEINQQQSSSSTTTNTNTSQSGTNQVVNELNRPIESNSNVETTNIDQSEIKRLDQRPLDFDSSSIDNTTTTTTPITRSELKKVELDHRRKDELEGNQTIRTTLEDRVSNRANELNQDVQDRVELEKDRVEQIGRDVRETVEDKVEDARGTAKELGRSIEENVDQAKQEANDTVREVRQSVGETAQELEQTANDLGRKAQDRAQQVQHQTNQSIEHTKAQVGNLKQSFESGTEQVKDSLSESASKASDKLEEASRTASQTTERMTETIKDTTHEAGKKTSQAIGKVGSFLYSTLLLIGTGAFLIYAHDSRAGIHKWVILPAVVALTKDDPEKAHEMAVQFIASGIAPVDMGEDDPALLATEVFGQKFSTPLGMAAGWDKHGQAINGLFDLGFSYVEIGSITPEPQSGNPKPRLFKLPKDESIINRYGFNSEGHQLVLQRLKNRIKRWLELNKASLPIDLLPTLRQDDLQFDVVEELLKAEETKNALIPDRIGLPRSLKEGKVLGINLGKNKNSDPDSIQDFITGVNHFGPFADLLVVNVSSPNTPGLRDLQRKGIMTELLKGVIEARDGLKLDKKPPVLVKIAPDVDQTQLKDIAEAIQDSKIDGIIISNTTISRPSHLISSNSTVYKETGGLSGPALKPLALQVISQLYELTDGQIPLIGCGGISSGQDAIDFAKAGASLVQLYTGFIYGGVGLPRKIKDEMMDLLRKEGKSWNQIIGTDRKISNKVEKDQAVKKMKKDEDRNGEKGTDVRLGERDFEDSLKEAKADLDNLLKELASFGSSSSTSSTKDESKPKADSLPPVNVLPSSSSTTPKDAAAAAPAPVAESFAPSPSSPEAKLSNSTENTTSQEKISVISAIFPRKPQIDESELAVPAQALLDDDAIRTLLDPAGAQTRSQEKKQKKGEEEKPSRPVKGGNERWV